MATYQHINYYMENDLGFKFKTHYKPTIMDFLRHVVEPKLKEIKSNPVEIPTATIRCKSFFEKISKQEKADNS